MKAYPTRYKGAQFRSRIEAKWAAFFDLLGWVWEYEPFDLDGYIPDFIVEQPGMSPRLIEVKPAMRLGEYEIAQRKIQRSEWNADAACVGAKIGVMEYQPNRPCFGSDWLLFQGTRIWVPWIMDDLALDSTTALWREAGNLVQWKGSASTP